MVTVVIDDEEAAVAGAGVEMKASPEALKKILESDG